MASLPGPVPLRFLRQATLPGFGAPAQQRLEQARVLVIGAGGLGSAVLPMLAAAGIGTLGIVDDDLVETTNLHRQTLHSPADVGRLKVDSAADRLLPIAAGAVTLHPVRFEPHNAADLARAYDLIVDGSDNFETRYLANDVARALGLPLVWGAVSQFGGHVGAVLGDGGPDYRDLFPVPPDPSSVLTCADGGVLPSVCGVIGSLMATEVLKLLTGIGEPLVGRITSYDALTGRMREVAFQADPERAMRASTTEPSQEEPMQNPTDGAAQQDELDAQELADLLASGRPLQLVDVREPWEAEIVSLPGSVLLPLGGLGGRLDELDPEVPIVAYCHHGARSERALQMLRGAGLPARHLAGGIDAYSRTVDPSLARY
ncbi:ThiF family adenylyltransferase [Naasia sp.]|uniref:ThiF family adenylyltransferase n=1 Tax=Naasia sp. TaxID=2546198 RepID=UPI00261EA597|nr:ThiF family adenylyltransferase [Naasia sp.]